jgi:hypothetical protein
MRPIRLIQRENNAQITAIRARGCQQIIELENEVTTTMDNLFVESPAHRAKLFSALRQDTPTALPELAAPLRHVIPSVRVAGLFGQLSCSAPNAALFLIH